MPGKNVYAKKEDAYPNNSLKELSTLDLLFKLSGNGII